MRLEEIRFYEGNNIKRYKYIIKIALGKAHVEEVKVISLLYIKLCEALGFIEKIIDIEKYSGKINLWVSYSDEEVAEFILRELILKSQTVEEIIEKAKLLKKKEFIYNTIKKAKERDIPIIRVEKGVYQLGYGKYSFIIDEDYEEEKIDALLDKAKTIPMIAVTGTNGKTTTSRLIYHLLSKLGFNTGLTSTDFIIIGKEKVEKGDTTGFLSARRVLENKSVEAAVFETARGGIQRNGLGYENADAAIFTSLSEDHIGIDEINNIEDLADIKSVIFEEVKEEGKWIIKAQENIINASIKSFNRMVKEGRYDKTFENKVCIFEISKNEFIKKHISKGGEALYLEEGYIVHSVNNKNSKLINVKDLPFTHHGISRGNILNVMAAIAALCTLSIGIDKILNVLKTVSCDIEQNPGRQNLLCFEDFNVILDYGHNKEAYKEIFSIVKKLSPKKVTAIVTAPGDRTDSHIKALGYLAGKESDFIIIREQLDQRGSSLGRVAGLLKEGVLEAGLQEKQIYYIHGAGEALVFSMDRAIEGEVIVLFTEELDGVLEKLEEYSLSKLSIKTS